MDFKKCSDSFKLKGMKTLFYTRNIRWVFVALSGELNSFQSNNTNLKMPYFSRIKHNKIFPYAPHYTKTAYIELILHASVR